MRRGMLTIWIACTVCACIATPSLGAPDVSDSAATGAYLRASEAYALHASADLQNRIAALEARANQIALECPSALTYAPRDEAFSELTGEIGTVVVYASAASARSLLLRASKKIGHLRWSNPKLTRLVRFRAAEENGVATVPLPDVCAEIAAWQASAYAALPESTSMFLARSEAIEAESFVGPSEELRETAILRLLKPYESPAERRIAERVERLEGQFGNHFSSAISAVEAKLAHALGASAL